MQNVYVITATDETDYTKLVAVTDKLINAKSLARDYLEKLDSMQLAYLLDHYVNKQQVLTDDYVYTGIKIQVIPVNTNQAQNTIKLYYSYSSDTSKFATVTLQVAH